MKFSWKYTSALLFPALLCLSLSATSAEATTAKKATLGKWDHEVIRKWRVIPQKKAILAAKLEAAKIFNSLRGLKVAKYTQVGDKAGIVLLFGNIQIQVTVDQNLKATLPQDLVDFVLGARDDLASRMNTSTKHVSIYDGKLSPPEDYMLNALGSQGGSTDYTGTLKMTVTGVGTGGDILGSYDVEMFYGYKNVVCNDASCKDLTDKLLRFARKSDGVDLLAKINEAIVGTYGKDNADRLLMTGWSLTNGVLYIQWDHSGLNGSEGPDLTVKYDVSTGKYTFGGIVAVGDYKKKAIEAAKTEVAKIFNTNRGLEITKYGQGSDTAFMIVLFGKMQIQVTVDQNFKVTLPDKLVDFALGARQALAAGMNVSANNVSINDFEVYGDVITMVWPPSNIDRPSTGTLQMTVTGVSIGGDILGSFDVEMLYQNSGIVCISAPCQDYSLGTLQHLVRKSDGVDILAKIKQAIDNTYGKDSAYRLGMINWNLKNGVLEIQWNDPNSHDSSVDLTVKYDVSTDKYTLEGTVKPLKLKPAGPVETVILPKPEQPIAKPEQPVFGGPAKPGKPTTGNPIPEPKDPKSDPTSDGALDEVLHRHELIDSMNRPNAAVHAQMVEERNSADSMNG